VYQHDMEAFKVKDRIEPCGKSVKGHFRENVMVQSPGL
jgi:hypothetical protein